MKFTIPRANLHDLLQKVSSAIAPRTSLPILSNVLVEVAGGELKLSGTDLDMSITTSAPVKSEGEGAIGVPARRILEIVRELPEDEVRWEGKGLEVAIKCARSRFKIMGVEAVDFPQLPSPEVEKKVSVRVEVLEKLYHRTGYAVSKDQTLPVFSGVLLDVSSSEMKMVATDRHRLAKAVVRGNFAPLGKKDVIVPPKAIAQAIKLAEGAEEIDLKLAKNYLIFETGTSRVGTRLHEGPFANYEQAIPKENDRVVELPVPELAAALRRVAIVADTITKQVTFLLKPGELQLSVSTADVGEAQESIPLSYEGPELEVSFNSAYVLEALRSFECERAAIRLKDRETAGILEPAELPEGEELLCLVMPLRVAQTEEVAGE